MVNRKARAKRRKSLPRRKLTIRCTLVLTETFTFVTPESRIKFWFPLLFGFYDVIMNGEDLEVRKRSLDYLFETLKMHGSTFPPYFWDVVAKEVLFPIFAVLRSRQDVSRFSTHEDMSVWLSTTMIQALRNLVDLFTFYFDLLGHNMLDKLLDLLAECICQGESSPKLGACPTPPAENDTLARIGTACLQQLVEQNVTKLSPDRWAKIVDTFIQLFSTTTAHQLFDERLRMPVSPSMEQPESPNLNGMNGFIAPLPLTPGLSPQDSRSLVTDRKRAFRQIIVKCVLQLLLIETSHELLQNEQIYATIPPAELLKLMAVLDESYRFAKRFNADRDLRTALWKVGMCQRFLGRALSLNLLTGFMKQLPNLLKQESSSAAVLVTVLLRMYNDDRDDHMAKRSETVKAFTP
jgi:brefeldin A-inhibited guanine nucleotide-exchange protein